MELDEKLAQLKINIKILQDEKKAWQAIRNSPPDHLPIFSDGETGRIFLPDFDLLGPNEGKIRGFLAHETASFDAVQSETESRLRTIQSSLEFQVDQFADNVHKLEQRVLVGKTLINATTIDILKTHRVARRYTGSPLSLASQSHRYHRAHPRCSLPMPWCRLLRRLSQRAALKYYHCRFDVTQAATLARAQTATHKDDKLYQPLCHQHKPA